MDGLFRHLRRAAPPPSTEYLGRVVPHEPGSSEAAWLPGRQAPAPLTGCAACCRPPPPPTRGISRHRPAYEASSCWKLRASALPEARNCADLLLEELRKVIPAFLHRVDREDRRGSGPATCRDGRRDGQGGRGCAAATRPRPQPGPSVRLTEFDPAGEDKVLTAIAYPNLGIGEAEVAPVVARRAEERARLLAAYVGERRRSPPPAEAGLRAQRVYTFDAGRRLRRFRTCSGTGCAPSCEAAADPGRRLRPSRRRSPRPGWPSPSRPPAGRLGRAGPCAALTPRFSAQAAAVGLAHRVRFAMTMNARELMHPAELRPPPGSSATWLVAQRMHRLVPPEVRRGLAEAMRFVVHDELRRGGRGSAACRRAAPKRGWTLRRILLNGAPERRQVCPRRSMPRSPRIFPFMQTDPDSSSQSSAEALSAGRSSPSSWSSLLVGGSWRGRDPGSGPAAGARPGGAEADRRRLGVDRGHAGPGPTSSTASAS